MATNPAWRVPLRSLAGAVRPLDRAAGGGRAAPAAIFFDFRQLHGDLDAEAPLRRVIRQAAGNRQFLGRLAAAALRRRPPLGFLGHLRGEHRGRIDLKAHGTAPIVDLARLFALEAGSPATATAARLRAAAEHGTAGDHRRRPRRGVRVPAAGPPAATRPVAWRLERAPDDVVALAELTMLQRRWIKDALHLVHTCQESVRIAYRIDLIA